MISKMKSLLLVAVLVLIGVSSCEKFLLIEPETELSTAIALDNLDGIESAVNGVYSLIHSDWVERQLIFAEALNSSYYQINPISNTNYISTLNHQSGPDLLDKANYMWDMSYRSLDQINRILEALPDATAATPEEIRRKSELEGETLFLRGLIHFVLDRFYGQPRTGLSAVVLTETITVKDFSDGNGPFRATIETIREQVIADLNAAEGLMADVSDNGGRANIHAVKGLLARVHFQYRNYTEAEAKAGAVINGSTASLIDSNVTSIYGSQFSSENVFTFLAQADDLAARNLFERFSPEFNLPQMGVVDEVWDLVSADTNDLRFKHLFVEEGGDKYTRKYDIRSMYIPYIRLSEMYLIRAESRAQNGNLAGGAEDMNRIRQRAGLGPLSYSDQADLLTKIRRERKIEMAYEGDEFHELRRREESIGGLPWNEAEWKLVFFLPTREIEINPNLVQNDLW